MARIGIVGAGNIGGTLAHLCLLEQVGDVVLCDVHEGTAKGKVLDLCQALTANQTERRGSLEAVPGPDAMGACDVVVITAGVPRRPDIKTREDLLKINASIMADVAQGVKKSSPGAFVVIISNPVDTLAWLFWKKSGFAPSRVAGMAGLLDGGRFRFFVAQELGVAEGAVSTLVVGPHNQDMLPLVHYTTVGGVPLRQWLENQKKDVSAFLDNVMERTRNAGSEIVGLLERGSAFFGPAHGALAMMKSVIYDQRNTFCCSVWSEKDQVFSGHPVALGRGGVCSYLPVQYTAEEEKHLNNARDALQKSIAWLEGQHDLLA